MAPENWLLFCTIAITATLSPGPAVLLVTTHSLQYGAARSLFTIFGNITGLFVMSLCSVLGLSTIILFSSIAFTVIKICGAAYLILLGIRLWRNGVQLHLNKPHSCASKSRTKLYLQGIAVALTNPKAIVFTSALFPQFIDHNLPLFSQFIPLVITFMLFSFTCLGGYSIICHKAASFSHTQISGKKFGRIFGSIFVFSGAALASSNK